MAESGSGAGNLSNPRDRSRTDGEAAAHSAIVARGVERRFGALRVLRGLDLDVPAGEVLALFGPNGAGKTTLLRTIAGLIRPNAGTVRVFGSAVPGGSSLRRRIGMIGHESFLYGDLTPSENLLYYARLYGLDAADRCRELLESVKLAHVDDRPVRTFSRGMVQRLSLARAILHEPDLLVMDEPFTGLDPHGSTLLEQLISDECKRGVTVVMTTHDVERGLRVCNRAVLLNRGRVAWDSGTDVPDVVRMQEVYDEICGPD